MPGCRHGHPAPRILVVDDDEDVRYVLVELLGDEGYDVRAVADGQVALDLLPTWPPCVILLDREMPVMNGPAFLEHPAVVDQIVGIPVVLLTAAADREGIAAELNAVAAVPKPFDAQDLIDVVTGLST